MPLHLILGRVGCGKTAYLAEEIAARIDSTGGRERITLIVPDQYTVASEDFFLSRLDRDGKKRSRALTVTSLKALARDRFIAHGVPARFIGEGGKTVLMKKAVDAAAPAFRYYPVKYRNPRFLRLLLGAVKELKAAGISAEDFEAAARRSGSEKLQDIARIRAYYEGYLSMGYFDPDDAPERLCKVLAEYGDFENEAVYVTNFRSFYNRERNILLQLVKNGADVTVTLPTDCIPEKEGESGSEVTADAGEEARRLTAYCRSMGEALSVVNLQEKASFSCEEFRCLENELAHPVGEVFSGKPEHIHLFRGADRFDEAEQAAATIARKVREDGCRYADFTLIVRSLEDYASVLDPVFEQYGIPLFYHRKTPLSQRSPIPMIAALFSLALDRFSQEAMLAFAGSGFVASAADAAQFERYVKVWDIRYNRFCLPFTRPIEGLAKTAHPDLTARDAAEAVRKRIVGVAEAFRTECECGTVREISAYLYKILEDLGVPETLDRRAEEYRAYGETELAARQKKVYEQLILSLDELVLTAGDEEITLAEYRDLLFAVIDTHDIAILPTSLDEVTAGSPETLPMISPRFVFVLGLNDGVFPRTVDDDRLLTDSDREMLREFGIGETTDDKVLHEMYYLYSALTAPREGLYLSYADVAGGQASPSDVVRQIKKMFPDLPTESYSLNDPRSVADRIQREKAAFDLHGKAPIRELGEYFASVPAYASVLQRRESGSLTPETAAALYPERMNVSPSKAGEYHRCRYAYFLRYGLGISPRDTANLNPAQRGTIIHQALEECISQGVEDLAEKADERVGRFGEKWLAENFGDDPVPPEFKRFFEALLNKIRRMLILFAREFESTRFRPVAYEQSIGDGGNAVPAIRIPLEHGSIAMIGTVDRVDTFTKDGKTYLRVVDYKSGAEKFDFALVERGLKIQMLMYLYALQQNMYPDRDVHAAAAQYVKVDLKVAKRDEKTRNGTLEESLLKERSGVYLNDADVLRALDASDGRIYLNVSNAESPFFITAQRFGQLFETVTRLLQKMGDSLHAGMVDKNPIAEKSKYDSCDRCLLKYYCRNPQARRSAEAEEYNTAKEGTE